MNARMKRELLLVDDDRRYRESVIRGLQSEEFVVHEASSVPEGIASLKENPRINVIVLGLDFPQGEGSQFLEEIKDHASTYRVIILTAHEELLSAVMAKKLEVFSYLTKTSIVSAESIRFAIEQAFRDLERAQLHKKLDRLLQIQESINSNLPLTEILNQICEAVLELSGADTCHIRLFDAKTGDFVLVAFKGPLKGSFENGRNILSKRVRYGQGYSGIAAERKAPIVLDDLQREPFLAELKATAKQNLPPSSALGEYLHHLRSAYVVPISTGVFGDEVDAVLNVTSNHTAFFSIDERRELVEEFVSQATLAIAKEWQRTRSLELRRDYFEISQILAEISDQARDFESLDRIFRHVMMGISRIINPELISIFLYDKKSNRLTTIAQQGADNEVGEFEVYHPGQSLTGHVFATGETVRIHTPLEPSALSDPSFDSTVIPSRQVHHYLAVPMKIEGAVVGVIRLINKKSAYYESSTAATDRGSLLRRGFSEDEETVLGLIVSHLGIVIQNNELIARLGTKVSELQTLNAAFKEEREKRLRAERDAVWKEVAFKAAHKLGNPVFAIETGLQGIRRRIKKKPDEALAVADEMGESVEKAKAIIEQFKSLTRAQEISPRPVDLIPLLESAAHVASENGVEVKISTPGRHPRALADPVRMAECFDELFANALHWFDKKEKKISIVVDGAKKKDLPATLIDSRRYLRIRFEDNGSGVPLEKKIEIFSPFFTTRTHGTGLGLSLVQRVIEGHNGAMRENGTHGEGAVFEIFIPLATKKDKEA